ncbi:MAG: PAS domain-containing protein [Hydrogenoanaerobacterium sp.]
MEPSLLNHAKTLVEFLSQVLGPDYEIALHDLRKDPSTVLVVTNGHVTDRKEGDLMSDLVLDIIESGEWETQDYLYNHKGISNDNKNLVSSTFFFKNKQNQLIGMLCINYDVSRYVELSQQVLALGNLIPTTSETAEADIESLLLTDNTDSAAESLQSLIKAVANDVLGSDSIPLDRLTQGEKLVIIERLYQKGIFSLKGSVTHVASALFSSEASIYRYLGKINKSPVA